MAKAAVKNTQPNLPKDTSVLEVQKREVFGRRNVKRLRKQGFLPANIYGHNVTSFAVQAKVDDFKKLYGEVGETGLVGLRVDGDVRPVLIHNVHIDPVTDLPLHVDFLAVNLSVKVVTMVPVDLVGESEVVRAGEGVVVQQMHELEVEALPTDLPEKVVVDISGLAAIDDAIKVSELAVDRSKLEVKDDPERIVVSIAPPAKEEEIAPPLEEVPAEGEVLPEGEMAPGGESPAEGEGQSEAKQVVGDEKSKEE